MTDPPLFLHCDLLFEHRGQDDRRGSAVFEPLDVIELAAERRRARHEGMGEPESQHRRREIHVARPLSVFLLRIRRTGRSSRQGALR